MTGPSNSTDVTGAGYIGAIFSSSELLVEDYRKAFSAEELLDALTTPLHTVGLYLAKYADCTPAEAGDAVIRTYIGLSHIHHTPPPNTESSSP